ncbi:TBC1 domain family member 5-like isoform X1 [Mya arenaria]|uniref:TBC1 domain family member 5-like isoform X1 n=1 Tax=Mya arenaria TaxID=6604 RepID=UPI0022E4E230|nr:TBC1 domain family member 5-like isoform X1 [Mya arenaria]
MSMEKMLSRLRSMSGPKLKSPTAGVAPGMGPVSMATPPSKEDILNTLESFGEKIPDVCPREDNNNVRRPSAASVVSLASEGIMEVGTSDSEPTITSITHSYSLEWEKLFLKQGYLRHLRNYAIRGNLRSSRFRSVSWKLFLEVLPEDPKQWICRTKKMRQKYVEIKDKLIVNPRKAVDGVDLTFNNPLSQEDESPWNRFFLDNELRLTIKQDVIRTFPEIEFYRSESVRALMIDILFCYSREHPNISYKQGMHELLAPMIFVLHCDHQAFLHASEMESLEEVDPDSRERIKYMLDPKYLEHDAYAMFSQVMETVEPWYVSKEVYPTRPSIDHSSTQPFARPQDLNPSNVIVTKLTRIQDYLLKKVDHELHGHLERQEIAPQIYGIRWIRLLFGREFPMQDILVLWDAIFADGIGFDLVDYIFVAMLLYLRDHLLSSDYPSCLITLMRYPPVGDIHYFIEKARHLRDPHQYPRPPTYTYQSAQTAERTRTHTEHKAANLAKSNSSSTNTLQSLTRKLYTTTSRPKTLTVSGRQKMSKSSSEPMNLQTDISPVVPTPGAVPQHKRGSSASLSQVEDTMFRTAPSGSSLARQESVRSAITTPDNVSLPDSPTHHSATLPTRGRNKARKQMTAPPSAAETELAAVRGLLHDKQSMCNYCANKMDLHIDRLQAELLHQNLEHEDEMLLSIAGIKQVRDILKGTLRWTRNMNNDEDIDIHFNHYKMDVSSSFSSSSAATDSSPDLPDPPHESHSLSGATQSGRGSESAQMPRGYHGRGVTEKRLFYVSSEENSEAIDSPSEGGGSSAINGNMTFKLPANKEFELEDIHVGGSGANGRSNRRENKKDSPYSRQSGPNEVQTEFSHSWSPDSDSPQALTSPDEDMEESPNPLYALRHRPQSFNT